MKKVFKRVFIAVAVAAMLLTVYAYQFTSAELQTINAKAPKKSATSVVSVVKTNKSSPKQLNYTDIKNATWSAISKAGGFKSRIKNNTTVVIKPNIVYDHTYYRNEKLKPEANGVTTDYRMVRAIVELVRKYNPNGKVYVLEGSSYNTPQMFKNMKYDKTNIPGVDEFISLERSSGAIGDTKSDKLVKVKLTKNKYSQTSYENKIYYLNKVYYESDFLISVPTVKTHWTAGVTGGIKNCSVGATPANLYSNSPSDDTNYRSTISHQPDKLQSWIHDYYACRPVDFVVADGLNGCQNGPSPQHALMSQEAMNLGVVLASADPVAADTVESLVMSWDPYTVTYLKTLSADGYGNMDPLKIRVVGSSISSVRKHFDSDYPNGDRPSASKTVKDYSDYKAPTLTVKSVKATTKKLTVKLSAGKDTRKIEITVDGKYISAPIKPGKTTYTINTVLKKGSHKVYVKVFDRYQNVRSKLITVKVK